MGAAAGRGLLVSKLGKKAFANQRAIHLESACLPRLAIKISLFKGSANVPQACSDIEAVGRGWVCPQLGQRHFMLCADAEITKKPVGAQVEHSRHRILGQILSKACGTAFVSHRLNALGVEKLPAK